MQTEPGRYRYRGWRQSARLVEVAKSVPCDLKQVWFQQVEDERLFETLQVYLTTLTTTQVAQIQRLRVQMRYRLKNKS